MNEPKTGVIGMFKKICQPCSDNGLTPNRRQTFTWANVASLRHNALMICNIWLVGNIGLIIARFMITSWNENIFRVTGPLWGIHWSPVISPHKGQWRGALTFSLISVWTKGWVSNRDASDLRRHCAHFDVTIMSSPRRYAYWKKLIHYDLVTSYGVT